MTVTTRSSQHDEILQETAARLIHILDVDKAIYACRDNYWHSVLPFILAYKRSIDRRPRPFGFAREDRNPRCHTLSQTVTQRHPLTPKTASPAIAA